MILAYVTVAMVLAALVAVAGTRKDFEHGQVVMLGWRQLRPMLIRFPVALIAAIFMSELAPESWFLQTFGDASGFLGILLASLVGALLPGGPMVSFPLALVLFRAGVGEPQMVALLTAWSVLAVHRVLLFELPMLHWPFVWRRLLASIALAPLAGVSAAVLATIIDSLV